MSLLGSQSAGKGAQEAHFEVRRFVRWSSVILLLMAVLGVFIASGAAAQPRVLLVLGDSLSSAFGIEVEAGWVGLLQERLDRQGKEYRVVNASISGDTTAAGLARLPRLLAIHRPAIVLVELGGNDGLRGLDLGDMRSNLEEMVSQIKGSGAQALLVGMRIPPNYGLAYTERFHGIYREVAVKFGIPLVPFLLTGVADDRRLVQADGIHPQASAQERILENVWPYLEILL
ncbi:MAG: arylesterase [Gammaproteobacteria bacterium]|jgi:acyl-CoA thioesterase-1